MAVPERLSELRATWITNFGSDRRIPVATLDAVLAAIEKDGPQSLETLLSQHSVQNSSELLRTLMYLLKFNILRLLYEG